MYIYETIALTVQNSPITWNQFHNYNIRVGNNHDLPQHRLKKTIKTPSYPNFTTCFQKNSKTFLTLKNAHRTSRTILFKTHTTLWQNTRNSTIQTWYLIQTIQSGTICTPYLVWYNSDLHLIQTRYNELTDLITDLSYCSPRHGRKITIPISQRL